MDFKLCQMCKKHPASVHVAQLSGGEYISIDLCEQCAENKGVTSSSSILSSTSSLTDILDSLLKKESGEGKKAYKSSVKCPGCRRSYSDFQESGRLGCAQCYCTFVTELEDLIGQVQKAQVHSGKVPEVSSRTYERQCRLTEFRHKLRTAIGNEEFDEAARLRDKIRDLEQQL